MKKTILIVDDDMFLAELLGKFLITLGYPQAAFAHDGGEGLLFLELNPDTKLVFTDLEMPNVDGEEFIKRFRSAGYEAKVIIMTGNITVDDNLADYAARVGADAALPKPFLPHKVFDALTMAGISPVVFK